MFLARIVLIQVLVLINRGFLGTSQANYFSRRNSMKITDTVLTQFFDILSQLGKMILYLYQLVRGKL